MTMRTLVLELIAAWKVGDAVRASAFFTPEAEYVEAGRAPIRGRDAILSHFRRFFRDGPNWRIEVDGILADANRAALEFRYALEGADGAWSERAGCALVHRRDGLIAQWREYQG